MPNTRTGRRRPEGTPWDDLDPGDYCWDGRHSPPCWVVCGPEGDLQDLATYTVETHANGTISVADEIWFSGGWRGWLTEGVWKERWP
jgi:hypothetical protein